MMNRIRYPLVFIAAVIVLTAATLISYGRIGATTSRPAGASEWPGGLPREHPRLVVPTRADYARFAADDSIWRARNARMYSVAELRARGDGTRSARELLDDRVFTLIKRGDKRGAVAALQQWVARNPRDKSALLSLARLLRETGRTEEAVARYRQLLTQE